MKKLDNDDTSSSIVNPELGLSKQTRNKPTNRMRCIYTNEPTNNTTTRTHQINKAITPCPRHHQEFQTKFQTLPGITHSNYSAQQQE